MTQWLRDGERIDDLQFCGLNIIQHPKAFRFSMDAVLLADFAAARPGEKVADLGTGTGILPLLISARSERTVFYAFEIQPEMADMAQRSVLMNGLESRIQVYAQDLVAAPQILGYGSMHLVVANPPYLREGASILNPSEGKRIARHEGGSTLKDFVQAASSLLRTKGRFCVVFPAQRMLELMECMQDVKIQPKRMRLVHPKIDRAPNLVLLEGVKLGRPMLSIGPPLIVYHEDGTETDEIKRIYHRPF